MSTCLSVNNFFKCWLLTSFLLVIAEAAICGEKNAADTVNKVNVSNELEQLKLKCRQILDDHSIISECNFVSSIQSNLNSLSRNNESGLTKDDSDEILLIIRYIGEANSSHSSLCAQRFIAKAKINCSRLLLHFLKNSKIEKYEFLEACNILTSTRSYDSPLYIREYKKALLPCLDSWQALVAFCKYPLTAEEQVTLKKLPCVQQYEHFGSSKAMWLAIRVKLNIAKADEELIALFKESIRLYVDLSSINNFSVLVEIVNALGYAGTSSCAKTLVGALSTNVQLVKNSNIISLRSYLIVALSNIHPEILDIFDGYIRVPILDEIITEKTKQLSICSTPSLAKFEIFIQRNYGKSPWVRDDLWFSCSKIVMDPQQKLFVKLWREFNVPLNVVVAANRMIVPYSK